MADESMDTTITKSGGVAINKNVNYTKEGDCSYGCWEYGQTYLVSDDSNTKIYVLKFDSIEKTKDFVLPLRYFDKMKYVNDVLFVNEEIATSTGKIEVVVKNIGLDFKFYIDNRIAKMDGKRQHFWYQHVGVDYKNIYRHLTLAISSILSQKRKHFEIPNLLNPGVILFDENGLPCFNTLKELKNVNPSNIDRSSVIIDIDVTMDYFLTRGAVDIIQSAPWEEKMKLLKVPPSLAKFNWKCKNWSSATLREPVQWVLDSSTLRPINEIVEWIYRIYDLVKLWKNDKRLIPLMEQQLVQGLCYKKWRDFIPESGPTRDVFKECERVRIAYEKTSQRKSFEFYNLVTFYRDMFEHYRVDKREVGDYAVYIEVEKHFAAVNGLCNTLRGVLGNVFCLHSNYSASYRWMDVMSSEFTKIVRDGREQVDEKDDFWK